MNNYRITFSPTQRLKNLINVSRLLLEHSNFHGAPFYKTLVVDATGMARPLAQGRASGGGYRKMGEGGRYVKRYSAIMLWHGVACCGMVW